MDNFGNKNWQNWNEQHPHQPAGFMNKLWEASSSYKNDFQPDVEAGFAAFKHKMNQGTPAKVVRLTPIGITLRIAAGAALLLVASLVLRNYFGSPAADTEIALTQEKTKKISLADGSSVLLNKSTQLDFPVEFLGNERKVKLEGEAFFQVSPDEKKPFMIETETAVVRVVGTSFNVRSYPDSDEFEVYVETGKVKVELKNGQSFDLTPGQFLRLDKGQNKASQGTDKTGFLSAWRTGKISFKGQPIPIVLMGMERLYGVKMELQAVQNPACYQTLTVQKNKLDEAIQALKTSCPKLIFSKNGENGYIVSGKCCE